MKLDGDPPALLNRPLMYKCGPRPSPTSNAANASTGTVPPRLASQPVTPPDSAFHAVPFHAATWDAACPPTDVNRPATNSLDPDPSSCARSSFTRANEPCTPPPTGDQASPSQRA